MKVLFVTNRPPYPPRRGDQVRAFHLLRHLARRHDITLAVVGSNPPGQALAAIATLGVQVRSLSVSRVAGALRTTRGFLGDRRPFEVLSVAGRHLRREIETLAAEHDLVHGHLLRVAPVLPRTGPVVVDLVDALSLNLRRRAEHDHGVSGIASRWEATRLARYERLVLARAAATLVAAPDDAAYLGGTPVVATNGVDIETFRLRAEHRVDPVVVFAGNLGYFPNIDAARRIAVEIMPLLRSWVPDASLVIAGARPGRAVRRLKNDSVSVVVEPEDIGAVVAAGAVSIVPMRAGTGIQNKVLEAMAVGTPVVTTPRVAAAIGAVDGDHLLVADGARPTAASAARIIADPTLAEHLRTNARRLVEDRFTWAGTAATVERVWEETAGQ